MKKRAWPRNPCCSFCNQLETTSHLLFLFLPGFEKIYTVGLAAICWAIWLARNRATFERKWINSPFEIVFTACAFLIYWAGLQKPGMEEMVKKGAEMLKANSTQMMLLCGPPPAPNMDGRD
ncbi:hypothetical protein VPH35_127217 [Triticum aestivum]